jgi:hypothetical protein
VVVVVAVVGVVVVVGVVGVDLVVGVVVGVVVVVVVGVVVVVVGAVDVAWSRQSLTASRAIVLAPWVRFRRSVGLTVAGSVCTSRFSAALAFAAAPQLPEETAELISSAWPLSAIDWSPESSPEPPPQATTNEAAKPSPPARIAREP